MVTYEIHYAGGTLEITTPDFVAARSLLEAAVCLSASGAENAALYNGADDVIADWNNSEPVTETVLYLRR